MNFMKNLYCYYFFYFSLILCLINIHWRLKIWKATFCQLFLIEKVNHQSFQTWDMMLDKSRQSFCISYKIGKMQLFLTHTGIKDLVYVFP